MLTVLHEETLRGAARTVQVRCRCECGTEFSADRYRVRRGRIKSCGCLRRAGQGACAPTHRQSNTSEYRTWASIKRRCYLTTDHSYDRYGGRGIVMCDRWRNSFVNFYSDMGPRPSPKHSIDRIDNNGPYAPENCRWATAVAQSNNRRSNRVVTFGGISKTLSQWARDTNTNAFALYARINTLGWSVERALTTPVRHFSQPRRSRYLDSNHLL